jgi:chemotaxis protein MotB
VNKARETIIIVRKKRGHGNKHHGGAWKVAFADFMTSMMALFLVLWIVTQSSDVRAAIAGYFQDPLGRANEFGATIIKGEAAQRMDPRPVNQQDVTRIQQSLMAKLGKRIQNRLQDAPDLKELAHHVEIQVTNEGLRIQLLDDSSGVFFETGSAKPRPAVGKLLELLGQELGTLPHRVTVEGYTDAVPYHLDATYTNWELSADRANAARRLMVMGGLDPSQVWEVRGHADRDLRIADQPTAAGNRRVLITMLFDAPMGPTPDGAGSDSAGSPSTGGAAPLATPTTSSAPDSGAAAPASAASPSDTSPRP